MRNMALKDLCIMKSGGTPSRKNPSFYEGEIPWAKISDLEFSPDGYIHDTKEHITQEALASINNRFFDAGTLFLAMYGSVGKTGISKIPMTTNQAILGINIKEKDLLDIDYLKYWFKTIKQRLLNRAVGAALPNISLTIVKELKIPLPPLDQQKKIAAILDAADNYRQKTKALIKKYDELTQSLFLELFGDPVRNPKGWEKVPLKDVIVKIGRGKSPKYSEYETGFWAINQKCIQWGVINPIHKKPILESFFLDLKNEFKAKKDDVLVNSTGTGTLGRSSVYNLETDDMIDSHVTIVRPILGDVKSIFLSVFFNQKNIQSEIYRTSVTGSTNQIELNKESFSKFQIYLPDLSIQNQFAERVQAIEAQKAQAQASLAQAEYLFNSLLQRAFKGELV